MALAVQVLQLTTLLDSLAPSVERAAGVVVAVITAATAATAEKKVLTAEFWVAAAGHVVEMLAPRAVLVASVLAAAAMAPGR